MESTTTVVLLSVRLQVNKSTLLHFRQSSDEKEMLRRPKRSANAAFPF